MQVLLKQTDIDIYRFVEGPPATGIRVGGSIPLRNPTDVIGDLNYLLTYTPPFNATTGTSEFFSFGAYTFPGFGQITWSGSGSDQPFMSITGGNGIFTAASGLIVVHPSITGFVHSIHLCKRTEGISRWKRSKAVLSG
jgi:hypothetical protein